MLLLADSLTGTPVYSLQSGEPVSLTLGPLISPEQLRLLGFYCQSPDRDRQAYVLLMSAIRQISRDGIVIDSADDIAPLTEIVRLSSLSERPFSVTGLPVVTELGQRLGKITNFAINLKASEIQKLHVRAPLWRAFWQAQLIIDRDQIVDISRDRIVVRDNVLKLRRTIASGAKLAGS